MIIVEKKCKIELIMSLLEMYYIVFLTSYVEGVIPTDIIRSSLKLI